MDTPRKPPTVLSLCSGYAGLEIGLERAFGEVNVLVHVEIEAFAVANLVEKMETGRMVPAPVWTDIKTFRPEIFRGYVDILTAGYPCPPFSVAGKRKGEGDPRHLWPHVKRIIKGCEPRFVFLENVEGHISKGIVQVLADLEEMAYKVECGIFSAEEVGAPHQRKRVFILGYSQGNNERRLPITPMHWKGVETGRPSRAELAHSDQQGSQGWFDRILQERSSGESRTRWPARPGEPQYEWEEPRTVADAPQ